MKRIERIAVQCVVGIFWAHLALWVVVTVTLIVEFLRMVTS